MFFYFFPGYTLMPSFNTVQKSPGLNFKHTETLGLVMNQTPLYRTIYLLKTFKFELFHVQIFSFFSIIIYIIFLRAGIAIKFSYFLLIFC